MVLGLFTTPLHTLLSRSAFPILALQVKSGPPRGNQPTRKLHPEKVNSYLGRCICVSVENKHWRRTETMYFKCIFIIDLCFSYSTNYLINKISQVVTKMHQKLAEHKVVCQNCFNSYKSQKKVFHLL